ncbi:hypothetical protein GS870_26480 [Rhodococcus hoagii]|nr:hypothetical protein [Prescottella equi]
MARRFPIVDAVGALFPSATVRLALDGAAARPRRAPAGAGRGVPELSESWCRRVWAAG